MVRVDGADAPALRLLELARRHPDVFVHGRSVGRLAERIGLAMGLPAGYSRRIRLAGVLHDIGKLAVPSAVLTKPGGLSAREQRMVERHPVVGASLVRLAGLELEASWIRHHHERFDGLGYPDRLVGEQIPLPSRILLVADAFDALTSDRPYREAATPGEALEELMLNAGSQFDAACAAAAGRLLGSSVRRGIAC